MRLWFVTVVLALTVRTCWNGIIVRHSNLSEPSQLVDAVVNVLKCHYKNGGKAAGLVGRMPHSFHRKLSYKLIPVTLLDDYRPKAYKSRFYRWQLYKLSVFVLTASSSKQFHEIIRMTENSKWWDRTARYLIVNWSSADNDGCIDSAKYLLKVWENSMINAKVICQNRTGGVKLYGYNPYTAEAREPWKLEKIYSRSSTHPFAVFSQDYINSHGICETIGADEAKNLAGYPFCRLEGYEPTKSDMSKWKSWMLTIMESENVFRMMLSTLNVTPVYRTFYENSSQTRPYFDLDKCMMPILYQTSFAALNINFGHQMYSYPIDKTQIFAVTQFRGHLTQLEKIVRVTDISSRLGLCLVLLLTLLFFKFLVRHSFMASFLNVLRLVCNTGSVNIPDNLSLRLYTATILFFAVVMQRIYRGNLAAILTQTTPIRDAMTKQDLVDMDYTIFSIEIWVPLCFADPMFDGHVVTCTRSPNCTRILLERPMTACLHTAHNAKDFASDLKLHVVGEPMAAFDASYAFPLNTHLEERINMILLRIREADITVPMHLRGLDRRVSEFEFDEVVQKNQDFQVITLGELRFAFVILGIGLSSAIITFAVEHATVRFWRLRTVHPRSEPPSSFSDTLAEMPGSARRGDSENPTIIES